MRVFSQGQLAQRCAQLLIAAFVWSVLCSGIVTVPAVAQVDTRSATNQSVAVVPFQNLSTFHPGTFGEEAAAVVAGDLETRLLLDVLSSDDVAGEMKNLGLAPPFTTSSLVRLATELEVNTIVWGEVREAQVVTDKASGLRHGVVTLAVHLFDRLAQGDMNGSMKTASSPASADDTDEELIANALKQASFAVVNDMKTHPMVSAVVIWAEGDQVFTNTGTRGNIKPGMKMVAIRNGERIAVVEMYKATATGSDGKVIEGSQLRTGDTLRGLYEFPGMGPKPTPKQAVVNKVRGLEKSLLTLGALGLVFGWANTSRRLDEGNTVAPGFTASGLANALTKPDVDVFPGNGANLVTWSKFSNTQSTRILGYMVSRDADWFNGGQMVDFVVPDRHGGFYGTIDEGIPQALTGAEWHEISITIDPLTGLIIDYGESQIFAPYPGPLPQGLTQDDDEYIINWFKEPPTAGRRHMYYIRPVIMINRSSDPDVPTWTISSETQDTTVSNYVTTIDTAGATIDQAMLVGSVATFLFYHPTGSDEMILQVVREQGVGIPVEFDPDLILTRTVTSLDPTPVSGGELMQIQVNFADLQALPGTGDVFWWRVGAHNRSDTVLPRPFPLNRTNDFGWIWSWPESRVQLTPSMSREALQHTRDVLNKAGGGRLGGARDSGRDRPMRVPR